MDTTKKGVFIVFDGPEGAGKTTQIALLKQELETVGYDVLATREPGGSVGAEQIRALVLSGDDARWDGPAELLLFNAARRSNVETLIKPALAEGKLVLCDRFASCTIAYQGFGRGLPLAMIHQVSEVAIGDFEPDLTFLFFIDPALGLQRAASRRGTEMRFESLDRAFHDRVREGYHYVLKHGIRQGGIGDQRKYVAVMVDNQPPEIVARSISDTIHQHISARVKRAE